MPGKHDLLEYLNSRLKDTVTGGCVAPCGESRPSGFKPERLVICMEKK